MFDGFNCEHVTAFVLGNQRWCMIVYEKDSSETYLSTGLVQDLKDVMLIVFLTTTACSRTMFASMPLSFRLIETLSPVEVVETRTCILQCRF